MRRARGFTLVELLVALFGLALLAALSWRGIDGMMRARAATESRADEVLTLQTGLAQWTADLEAIMQLQQTTPIDWNGRVLRLTRTSSAVRGEGVRVVAWTRREGQWRRWSSPPVSTRGELQAQWLLADLWSQNPGDALRQQEVAIAPLDEWQIFYFRDNSWTNPMSAGQTTGAAAAAAASAAATGTPVAGTVPDGVRLVLDLPPGHAISGRLQRDWVRP
jgi:general secretion pathway protein J